MSKVRVAGFGLSLDGFSAGIEQSLSDPLGSRGRFGDRHRGCGGRVAGDWPTIREQQTRLTPNAVRSG
jgi:hypothetical protein